MTAKPWFVWGRLIAAVVVGELVPILLLVGVVAIWGPSDASEADLFARRLGAWIGPMAGALTIFAVSWWAGSKSARPVLQGALIGLILAVLDVTILVAAGESFAWVFVLSNAAKVASGALGGWISDSLGNVRRHSPAPSIRSLDG